MQATELKLYSVKEVAGLLGKHRKTIINWIRAGHLKALRAGPNGKYMIPEDSIDEFLEQAREENEDAT